MYPKKPFDERSPGKRRADDELDAENTTGKKTDGDTTDVDDVIDKESYTDRNHGRTHDGSADVNNPGTA